MSDINTWIIDEPEDLPVLPAGALDRAVAESDASPHNCYINTVEDGQGNFLIIEVVPVDENGTPIPTEGAE